MKFLLDAIKPVVWHNIKRFIGVLGVVLVLAGPAYIGYQSGYKKGFAVGSDKPTNTFNAPSPVTNFYRDPKDIPILIGLKIMRVGIGFMIERK